MLCAFRRAIVIDERNIFFDESLGEFDRIRNRRRRENELRRCAIKCGDALQSANDVGDVRAKYPAIHVHFVDDNELQIAKELCPNRVMRQNAGVHHIGIGNNNARGFANGGTEMLGRVAVVGGDGRKTDDRGRRISFGLRSRGAVLGQICHLVLRQRFRRKQVQRARLVIAQEPVQHGQIVAQRFAARCPSDDDDVFAVTHMLPRGRLMRVQ